MQINRTALSKQTFTLAAFAFCLPFFVEGVVYFSQRLGNCRGKWGEFFTLQMALGWIDNNLARVYLGFN